KSMARTHLVIVEVVSRGDLDAAGAELRIDVVVGDHGGAAAGERQADALSDQLPVAFVLRVHGYGDIAQHRFRTRGCDDHAASIVNQRGANLPKRTVLFLAVDLEVGDRSAERGA